MPALTFTHPTKYGKGSRECRVCSSQTGIIRKYHIFMCRQCFRDHAHLIGFRKVRAVSLMRLGFRVVLCAPAAAAALLRVLMPPLPQATEPWSAGVVYRRGEKGRVGERGHIERSGEAVCILCCARRR